MVVLLSSALFLGVSPAPAQDPLLLDLEHRAVRFFWEQSNPANGFTKDRATNSESQEPHPIASCASVGFALSAYSVGTEHQWLSRKEALDRTRLTLQNLVQAWPHERGWLYHFVDWETGKREWKCEASSIDTSICLAGVLLAKQYWKDPVVTKFADQFTQRIDWKWMRTSRGAQPESLHFAMGWHPESGFIKAKWDHFDECKMLYVQAYGLTDMPADSWTKLRRDFASYKGIDFISGGPLFMHQMSESFYDFSGLRDGAGVNYAIESRNAALANRQYCIDNPKKMAAYGPDFWGLSACDGPDGYDAFGAPNWINDNGTITPTSAVAAIRWLPKESLTFAKLMRSEHARAWGLYGFPNGYNPQRNWVGPDVIGIDLGMMMMAIESAGSGLPYRLAAKDPVIQKGFRLAGYRKDKSASGLLRE